MTRMRLFCVEQQQKQQLKGAEEGDGGTLQPAGVVTNWWPHLKSDALHNKQIAVLLIN